MNTKAMQSLKKFLASMRTKQQAKLLKDTAANAEVCSLWNSLEETELAQQPAYAVFKASDLGFISTDLSEATYSTPHEVLDWNCEFLDEILKEFLVWKVYHRLFKLHDRKVDCSELNKKEYFDKKSFTTMRGGFMGDPLSFVHLTLQMSATVNAAVALSATSSKAKHERPLGQGAGDDQLLVGASLALYKALRTMFEQTHMVVSKIDSWSPDSMTFCEQYALKPTDVGHLLSYDERSRFSDLFYLDIIKGSLLSGKSKVKAVGAVPLLGHSRALNTQVSYHPIKWVKERAPKLLWAANYIHAAKLASSMASLPLPLGGVDMALGKVIEFEDEIFQKRLPYYEAIAKLPQEDFMKYSLLLQGIYKANPKGFTWDNSPELLKELCQKLTILSREEYENITLPLHIAREGHRAISRYIKHTLSLVSFREIIEELTRRDAFIKLWHEEVPNGFLSLPLKEPKSRMTKAWQHIYSTVEPIQPESRSIMEIAHKFDLRTWGFFVSREDPAITELFDGMPSLFIDYGRSF